MAFGLISKLKELFDGDPAVRKVADDPALTAELLLLFRMILADGEVKDGEMEALRRICQDAFGIEGGQLQDVLRFLQDFGYETSTTQALAIFEELPHERRVALARHLADIAKADADLSRHEVQLLARTLEMLGLRPRDVVRA
ncbi:TerB family tellurite resistance protein [Aquamicrobium sp. LC103]|uniref:tellurite resistance TerB family protein n=1 Tax=Aquamicrobium sp. LC103 TaxID=1120658 RepID=UPI00063E6EBF|nr:TerB family tellurite resistance protein [Aquamicrobium sp. LC103]TKT79105.1 hypothetical protein XW59_009220 [Aquamicrobium sp. LC103]